MYPAGMLRGVVPGWVVRGVPYRWWVPVGTVPGPYSPPLVVVSNVFSVPGSRLCRARNRALAGSSLGGCLQWRYDESSLGIIKVVILSKSGQKSDFSVIFQ